MRQAVTDNTGCLAVRWSPPGGDGVVRILQACGAWRCVMPAKLSRPSFRLVACDARQADLVQCWCVREESTQL